MIYILWLIWYITTILMCIVLLNFLIAYISQSFERVVDTQTSETYLQRCNLNRDCYLLSKLVFGDTLTDGFFITASFQISRNEDEEKESLGVIKQVRTMIHSVKYEITGNVQSLHDA